MNQTAETFGYPDTLIYEYDHWLVLLREQQVTLGSLVMCTKTDATEFSGLPEEAYTEMGIVTRDIERVLARLFKYEKINYLMLMMVDPHVHFHVLPRYSGTRSVCGLTIKDEGWPGAPQLNKALAINEDTRDKLRNYICNVWKSSTNHSEKR